MNTVLTPMLALVCWTLVMWSWMYATRLPAMKKAGINAAKMKEKAELDVLPREVRQVADNYNHLHEQPVLFYALVAYTQLAGTSDGLMVGLAWAYVALRVAHSLWQARVNFIPIRFVLFSLSTLVLVAITLRNVLALLG